MIRLKDLQNRIYQGRYCTGFDVQVKLDDKCNVLVQFTKAQGEGAVENQWRARVILDRTRDKDSDVYNFDYIMPKSNVPLELIAATGLKYFQLYLKGEIESKVALDFSLGEMLEGM